MQTEKNRTHAPTRRRMIAAGAITLCGSTKAGAQPAPAQPAKTGPIVPCRAIHQEEDYKVSPQRIYKTLLESRQFTAFSGGRPAEIHREVGGTFSVFAGHIIGRNLELVPNQRIVQAWRVVSWSEGIYSIARFELKMRGSGTRVIFDHTGFPSELAEHLENGWQENYWKPLRKYLG